MKPTVSKAAWGLLNLFKNPTKIESSPGVKALDEIDKLMASKQYKEAYFKLEEAAEKYPGLYKTIPFYRGKILTKLEEQQIEHKVTKPSDNSKASNCPEMR
jgi:hypothetical protein